MAQKIEQSFESLANTEIYLSCNCKTSSYSRRVINILLIMQMFLDQKRSYNNFTA